MACCRIASGRRIVTVGPELWLTRKIVVARVGALEAYKNRVREMDKINYSAPVSVFEQDIFEVAARLSISNIPLAWALRMIHRWPQERREGVLIEMSDRTVAWADVDELYGRLYRRSDTQADAPRCTAPA